MRLITLTNLLMFNSKMKNKLFVSTVGILILSSFLVSPSVLAQTKNSTSTGNVNFCTSLDEKTSKIVQDFNDNFNKFKSGKDQQLTKWENDWTKWSNDQGSNFARIDAIRTNNFTKLESKATTDAERQAIVDFKTAIEAAVAARRSVVNTAIQTFRDGVKTALTGRAEIVEKAMNDRLTAFEAAVTKAKSDCASNIAPKTVRTAFVSSLKKAQDAFKAAKKADENLKSKIETLRKARNTAVSATDKSLKTSVTKAQTDLKKVFTDKEIKNPETTSTVPVQ